MTRRIPSLWFCLTALVPGFAAALQTDLPGPPGSEAFGSAVHVLPNGNLLIVDPEHGDDDEGAIHLYAPGGTRISTLSGSRSGDFEYTTVTILGSGHAVVANPLWDNGPATDAGAVTFVDSAAGRSGTISAQNSLVGTRALDHVGFDVRALPAGGYLVQSRSVDLERDGSVVADVGAWTFGRGDVGVKGTISASNSLLGSTPDDFFFAEAVVLSDGHVALAMPYWDHGAIVDAGAVAWMNGTTGATGVVSAANAFVGAKPDDRIGQLVTALTQGHYLLGSPSYDDDTRADAGAVTWRRGGAPRPGVMSGAESLLGSSAQDYVGFHVLLPNGRVLVLSPNWRHSESSLDDVGAVTLVSGTAPTNGRVTAANSLTGSHADDRVGEGGIVALANGKVVVKSPRWGGEAGAATWLDPAVGLPGHAVSADNSLVGTAAGDRVGLQVVALANGHYVVGCPTCDRGPVPNAGAVVWCDGAAGRSGVVSIFNAFTGTSPDDAIGTTVVALPNGNYVSTSAAWDHVQEAAPDAGAVTWFDGTSGTPYGELGPTGEVGPTNSLVGATPGDRVSDGYGVVVLASGDFVVRSPRWDRGNVLDAGAVTFVDAGTGRAGTPSVQDSLVGTRRDDGVGGCDVRALPNGGVLVSSCFWDHPGAFAVHADAGAVTWSRDGTDLVGEVSSANSLVPPDGYGERTGKLVLLPNGDYAVVSERLDVQRDATRLTDAGAVTLGRAATGARGTLDPSSTVFGGRFFGGDTFAIAYSPRTDQLVVGRPEENLVSFLDERLLRDGFE